MDDHRGAFKRTFAAALVGLRAQSGAAAARDCAGLQVEFDTADAGNQATMTRTGHNNAVLMDYIDDKLRGAGCY